MNSRSGIFVVISILVVAVIYGSSSTTLQVLAEPSGSMTCHRSGTVTETCCQDHIINRSPSNPAGTLVTYCTDCKIGPNPTTYNDFYDCSERYIPMGAEQPLTPIPPAAVARLQGILGEATTLPEVSVLEAQRANITILPGGIIQETNTSSDDNSEQADLASDETENTTRTANDEGQDDAETEEQDDSGPSMKQGPEGADNDKENIDEELPLE